MKVSSQENKTRQSLAPCSATRALSLGHPGCAEDYTHQGDLMSGPFRLIFSEVHCYALMAGVDVMNK